MANITITPIATFDPRSVFQRLNQKKTTDDNGKVSYKTLKTKNTDRVVLQCNGHITDTPEAQPVLQSLAKLTTSQLQYIHKLTCDALVKADKNVELPDELEFDDSVQADTMWYAQSKGTEGKTQFRISKEDSKPITFIEYKVPRPQATGLTIDLKALAKQ